MRNSITKHRLRFRLTSLSIRTRLALIIAGVVSAILLLSGTILMQNDIARLQQQLTDETKAVSRVVAQDFTRLILLDSPDIAADVVSRLSAFPMIVKADVYDTNGDHALHYARDPKDHRPARIPEHITQAFVDEKLLVRSPVQYDGTTLGEAHYVISTDKLQARKDSLYKLIAMLSPIIIIVVLAASFALQRSFIRPLTQLANAVRQISKGRNLSTRLQIRDSSEFGELFAGFNHMLDTIEQASSDLQSQKEHLQVTLESIADGVIATDKNGGVVYLNSVAEQMCGTTMNKAEGKPIHKLYRLAAHPKGHTIKNPAYECMTSGSIVKIQDDCDLIAPGSNPIGIHASSAPIKDVGGKITGSITVMVDVTANRSMADELNYQATHDPLTKLLNRRAFEAQLDAALVSAHERSDEHVLLYMDLDQFKVVNDTCGHAAGDELLRQLSMMLRTKIRAGDCLARLGGDEFGLILMHCALDNAIVISEEIRSVVMDFRFEWMDEVFSVGVSIGVTPVTKDSGNAQQVLSNADTACYQAKDAGRNRSYVYKKEDEALSQRQGDMAFVSRLRKVLDDEKLVLFCQKIVPLDNAEQDDGHHYEILLRMQDEKNRLISPGQFMPAAERYGLIEQIDLWVVKNVIRLLQENPAHTENLNVCAINLSGITISQPSFLDAVEKEIRNAPHIGEKLCLEITETAAIGSVAPVTRVMKTLRNYGVHFALDDFGTGMSSLSYLKTLPVDYVKIDGAFVRDIVEDEVDRGMVRAINELAHVIGKRTVAEFVESEEALQLLRTLGVDLGQGYHLHKPEPFDNVLAQHSPQATTLKAI